MSVYVALFVSALLSATLLPGSSEVMLVSLAQQDHGRLSLWLWATAGNTLGSCVNWWLGRFLLHFRHRRWFPFRQESLRRSQDWFQRYGLWSLLLSWAPVVGDGITFIAGVMRTGFVTFLLLVGIAKGLRYAILLGLADAFGRLLST
jgi:membrane protein YqaA with SNARE-associated domain